MRSVTNTRSFPGLLRTTVIFTLVIFYGFACTAAASAQTGQAAQVNQTPAPVLVPPRNLTNARAAARWEGIYFASINVRTAQSGLVPLRTYSVPAGDREVRIWIGFGLTKLEGLLLKRTNGVWSGTLLHAVIKGFESTRYLKPLPEPKAGWDDLWNRLEREEFFTLPDQEELPRDGYDYGVDGIGYVVEINREGTYRTYLYTNPDDHKRPQDRHMVAIARMLEEQFRLRQLHEEIHDEWKRKQATTAPRGDNKPISPTVPKR